MPDSSRSLFRQDETMAIDFAGIGELALFNPLVINRAPQERKFIEKQPLALMLYAQSAIKTIVNA